MTPEAVVAFVTFFLVAGCVLFVAGVTGVFKRDQ